MKELFMKQYYPEEDLEREYLINDSLAKDREYEEFLKLQKDPEINIFNTKIEVKDAGTRVEIHQEDQRANHGVES